MLPSDSEAALPSSVDVEERPRTTPPSRALSAREERLLDALCTLEESGRSFSVQELASMTGYKPSSVRTYFTKKLEGVLVHRADGDLWRARGARECSPAELAELMTQRMATPGVVPKSEAEWRAQLRTLLALGHSRGYRLPPLLGASSTTLRFR